MDDRQPPVNLDAERAVLGSCIRDNFAIDEVASILKTESFSRDAHQKTFEAIVFLRNKSRPIDLVTLADYLKELGYIDDVGGYTYLAELWDAAPTSANAFHYAKIVKELSILRSIIQASTETLRDAYDRAQPAEEILGEAEKRILEIGSAGIANDECTLEEAIQEAYDRIDSRKDGEFTAGVRTGFTDLDEMTSGLHDGEVVLIAARPGVGKTAFALNLVRNIITTDDAPILFVSLEQSRVELAERLLCCHGMVDSHRLRRGTLGPADIEKLVEAGGILSKHKLFIDDTPSQTMLRIASSARRLKKKKGIRAVFIDYLQLIESDIKKSPRQEQVSAISRSLKYLSRELKIPIVAMAQVNRSTEDRSDHRPRLSDLRESGSLEQDADVVMMLHRSNEGGEGQMEVIIAKQRNGRTGDVSMMFIGKYMKFDNFATATPFGAIYGQ